MGFTALTSGMFSVMAINRKLREIWVAIEAIEAHVGMAEAETTDESTKVVAEPQEVAETASEPVFDWKTSDDVSSLKEFAMEKLGLEIKGNKKADTVRNEIYNFLELQEG